MKAMPRSSQMFSTTKVFSYTVLCIKFIAIMTFTDIDECITNNGGCEQFCHNTVGSYYCTCNNSYTLNADNHMCDGKLIWCVGVKMH